MERLRHKSIEYVVASLTELDEEMRCDAEYFLGIGLNDKPFRSGKGATVFSQYGTSKELNEEGQGFPILRLNEFQALFLGKPSKYSNLISEKTYQSLQIKKNDVLISRTNGNPKLVGKAAVSMKDEDFGFASYLFRIRTDEKFILPEVLTSYLSSIYGRGEIEKFSMISNQANFSPAKFRKIKIPSIPSSIQKIVSENLREAYRLSIKSQKLFEEAEQILLSELGLENWKPKSKKIKLYGVPFEIEDTANSISSIDFFNSDRLDAEYWHPKYDEFFAMLKKKKDIKFSPLGKYVTWVKGIEIGSKEYLEEGAFPFVRVSNITRKGFELNSAKYVKPDTFSKLKTYQIKKGEILLSKDGTAGIAYLVREEITGIQSSGILRLTNISKLPSAYIELVLNSPVVQIQIERKMSGAIIQHLKVTEAMKFIIPEIPSVNKVAQKVELAFSSYSMNKQLILKSKTAIEIFIEQDEKAAIKYIKQSVK